MATGYRRASITRLSAGESATSRNRRKKNPQFIPLNLIWRKLEAYNASIKPVMITIMDKPQTRENAAPLRMTRQRRVILEELSAPGRHPTADAVYQHVRRKIPNISLGTVYRNLEILSQAGMVKKLHIGSGQKRYERALRKHYHVRCTCCGCISDVPSEPFGDLEQTARDSSGFEITGLELEFEGLCRECRDSSPARQ